MKTADLRVLDEAQLDGAEINARRELFEARLARSTGELEDRMRIRHLRRDLARILTIKGERRATKETHNG